MSDVHRGYVMHYKEAVILIESYGFLTSSCGGWLRVNVPHTKNWEILGRIDSQEFVPSEPVLLWLKQRGKFYV